MNTFSNNSALCNSVRPPSPLPPLGTNVTYDPIPAGQFVLSAIYAIQHQELENYKLSTHLEMRHFALLPQPRHFRVILDHLVRHMAMPTSYLGQQLVLQQLIGSSSVVLGSYLLGVGVLVDLVLASGTGLRALGSFLLAPSVVSDFQHHLH